MLKTKLFLMGTLAAASSLVGSESTWTIDSQVEWHNAVQNSEQIELRGGEAKSTGFASKVSSVVKRYEESKQASSITFTQSDDWNNWREIEKVGVPGMEDAPVFVPVKDGEYYLLARYRPASLGKKNRVNGVDVSETRPKSEQGYHAWLSSDMKSWEHLGPVSGYRERWVTTAEYVDGDFYIYYDNPNDEDPHLIIDSDIRDGKMGYDYGMVFADPSHGSDSAIIRDDKDGKFHLIYENWDPLNARTHAWDSPLAGHAVSPDGIHDFRILPPAVDHRTNPTGEIGEYVHGTTKDTYQYEIHTPEQNAYGDWTAIKIGEKYYLFCDFDPVGEKIRVGRFVSDSLDREFEFVGELGEGHPDPTIGFAEGQFYLIRQRAETDFISSGPWVPGVEARVGVDTSNDGKVDKWTKWQSVAETYSRNPDYVRVVETAPARLDLSGLPAGYGFAFEYRTTKGKDQSALVKMERVELVLE
ncbi:hypothetical protein [Pelagicoccus mobilis]|uniref:Uncharacterized protein n=1 Tax=Pelagicoccus mobilis TaxID=415221 RepID=A0A934RY66_9BACT|nr:hypothetical protein [Pelagicoccus mobilis]MBK1877635.1 hypothetical protein [Pelagicoccus mobilis]